MMHETRTPDLMAAARILHEAGLLGSADYYRTINRIRAIERVRDEQ